MALKIGQVDATGHPVVDGVVTAGRLRKGVFNVTYDDPFRNDPVVVVTALAPANHASGVSITDSNREGFTVSIKNMDDARVDRAFNFIAADE
jgi:hypothetical protein